MSKTLTSFLSKSSPATLSTFAIATSFAAYFCMYAFRKPFAAASYGGPSVHLGFGEGSSVELKTLFVISQILGYMSSKYIGIRVCSQTGRGARVTLLLVMVLTAEAALVAFGAAPESRPLWKAAAIFCNGLPLGMVWGLLVLYLEGRRTSELLLAGLSCSYIIASGMVKDIGRALLAGADFPLPVLPSVSLSVPNPFPPVPEYWMPAATGALFFIPFACSVWLLNHVPEPTLSDIEARTHRTPMSPEQRRAFVRQYFVAIASVLVAYLLLTAFRDYRDNYMVDIFAELNYDYESNKSIVSRAELIVAFGVLAALALLSLVQDNRLGLLSVYAVMIGGVAIMGGSTLLLDYGRIDGFWWMSLIGLGAYLAYVPYGSVLFDRVIASTRFAGTAVFGIYLADSIGYTGSVVLQLAKDLIYADASRFAFLRIFAYVVSVVGVAFIAISGAVFLRGSSRSRLGG